MTENLQKTTVSRDVLIKEIEEHKQAEEALKKSEERLKAAQHIGQMGDWDWDIVKNKLYWSDEIYHIFGLKPQSFCATYEAFLNYVHSDDREIVEELVNKALLESTPYSIDHRIVLPDGTERIVHEQAEVIFDENGKAVHMAGTVHDITERKRMEEKLKTLSLTDELTGLYNRRGFSALAGQQIKIADRQKKRIYMLYADLDNLKKINDTYGHNEGDCALSDFAEILKSCFRGSDVVGRIGGDEFTVIPIGIEGDNKVKITERLQRRIELFNEEGSRAYKLSVSIGIALYDPGSPCSLDDLILEADRLMYEEKRRKKSPET
jgi:diguanylate cyclase (GGDEF)-like protein/PAS domain S-box-containing protein